jgi:hypothetical protein
VKCVSGLDGSTFHSPLCWVGVARGSARGDVRQVGRDGVCFVTLFEMSDAGERNVVLGVVRGVMRKVCCFGGAVTR